MKEFICKVCNNTQYYDKSTYIRHLKSRKHFFNAHKITETNKLFRCTFKHCKFKSVDESILNVHYENHVLPLPETNNEVRFISSDDETELLIEDMEIFESM
jgi:hypothetical protein